MKLADLLATNALIPSLPEAVSLILDELEKDEPDMRRLGRLLSGEMGLTVRILRLVNSARFSSGSQQRIASVETAMAMLGLAATRQLVQAAAVGGAFRHVPGVDMTEFWRHSLDVAKIAQSLALEVRLDPSSAFTAGLLHGTGDLIMKMAMPGRPSLQPAFASDDGRHAAQLADLGYGYPEVGAVFAASWRFPVNVVDAIRYQCEPEDGGNALSSVLFLAAWSARAHELDIEGDALLDAFPQGVADTLGLPDTGRLRQGEPIAWTEAEEARSFS